MLRAKGIRAAYGTDEIVHGVDIDLHPGEAVALLGPNGSGKTTLLRVLAGSLTPTAGSVQVQGADIRRLSPRERARRVAVLSQRNAAPRGMTALQMVLLGRYPWLGWWGSYSAEDRRIAHEALEETGALPLAGRQEVLTQTEALEAVGIPVLVYEMQSFEQLFAVTRALGRLTGRETRAEALVADWQRRLAVLEQRYAGQPPVRVFYEVRYPNLLAAGRASIVDEIIRHAGGRNVLDAPQKLVRCNEEMLVALDPEAYILQQGPMNPAPQAPAARPHYRGLSAVRSGRVLLVDEHLFARPGPRSVEAAERLARWLHGEEQGSGK